MVLMLGEDGLPTESYAAHRQRLLAAGFPTAALVVFGLIALYAVSDFINNPTAFPSQLTSYAVQLSIPILALLLARGPLRAHVEIVALAADLAFTAVLALTLFLPATTESGTALFLSLKMIATAVLFPWPPRLQYVSSGFTLFLYLAVMTLSGRSMVATHQLLGPISAAVLSAIGATHAERTRRKLFLRSVELSESEEQLRAMLESERSLVAVAREISVLSDLPTMLERINRLTAVALGCDFSTTCLVDTESGELATTSTYWKPDAARPESLAFSSPLDTPLMHELLEGRPVVINDRAQQSFVSPEVLANHHVERLAYAPIIAKGRLLGVLSAGGDASMEPFDDRQVALLKSIAAQAAVGIDNAQLFDGLATSEAAYRDLFERANDLIFVVRESGTFRFANRAALDFVQATAEDLQQLAWPEFLSPSSVGQLKRRIMIARRRRLDSGRPFEVEVNRPDGTTATLELRTQPISPPGHPPAYHCVARDVTERRRQELETRQLLRRLQESSRLQAEFVANMSHELRTPLNVIIGYSDLLSEDHNVPVGGDTRSFVNRIGTASRALHRMVESVLEYARLDRGRAVLIPTRFSTEAMFLELRALCNDVRSSPDVRVRIDSNADIVFSTDYDRLYSILSNLLLNALKFTPRGDVELTVKRLGADVEFCVHDTGIGIAPEEVAHVFEPFRQVDGSPTRHFGGLGLGLAIVRRNLDLLGGSVQLESQTGQGSTFRIRIPMQLDVDAGNGRRQSVEKRIPPFDAAELSLPVEGEIDD